MLWPYALATLIGTAGGVIDLVSREGWPDRHVICVPAFVYVLVNGAASAVALLIANLLQLTLLGFGPAGAQATWIRVAVAGLGGVAVIRTSIGRHSDPTRSIVRLARWFEELMDIALAELDDRRLRAAGAPAVNGVMRRVSFSKAQIVLPTYLATAYADRDKAKQATDKIAEIRARKLTASSDRTKALLMGTELAKIYSVQQLRAAVQSLARDVRPTGSTE